jgi:hypothetical protein
MTYQSPCVVNRPFPLANAASVSLLVRMSGFPLNCDDYIKRLTDLCSELHETALPQEAEKILSRMDAELVKFAKQLNAERREQWQRRTPSPFIDTSL